MKEERFLDECIAGHPVLAACRAQILDAFSLLERSFAGGGMLLVCGNGGSAADSAHIVGELMKGFLSKRTLPGDIRGRLAGSDPEYGPRLAEKLQGALPAVNLAEGMCLSTAFANDVDAEFAFAQAVVGYAGRGGDGGGASPARVGALLGLSTSGNARNVLAALAAARGFGLATLGMTGSDGGAMKGRCDVLIRVPAARTHEVQELHQPVYHCLCAMIEARFFA